MPKTGARFELNLGGTWTDITGDVYLRDRVKITRGRQDEASAVKPSSCSLTLNNKSGKYSPRNPLSPYYGLLTRNTPLRVSVAAGRPFLYNEARTAERVTTPATAALKVTGDLDARWDVECADLNSPLGIVELGGQWGAAGQKAWHAYLYSGYVTLVWTTDGTTEVLASGYLSSFVHARRLCVRVTVDVNNGTGGRDVAFYAGPTLAGPWTQVGTTQTFAGTTATFSSTSAVEIGDNATYTKAHVGGRIYAAQLRSGIGGTIVAAPDFTTQAPGAASFTDSAGVPWTASSTNTITNRRTRFVGEVSEWPSRWDVSGGDVYVPLQAQGIMRRLAQGTDPLDSTLRRRIAADASVVAYWPMEDGSTATQAYSPLPGIQPMTVIGGQMASDDTLAGSLALPTWPQGSRFVGVVPSFSAPSGWQVQCVFRCDASPVGPGYTNLLIVQATGTVRRWEIAIQVGAFRVRGLDASGNLLVDSSWTSEVAGPWTRLRLGVTQSGGTINWAVQFIVVGQAAGAATGSVSGTAGRVSDVHQTYIAGILNLRVGHVAVFNDPNDTAFDLADTGFDGETAGDRMKRLAAEENVPLTFPYGLGGTELVGPQTPQTFPNLMQEAATADVGILYEQRDQVALAARPRQSLYNQAPALALDYSKRGEVAPPLEPTEDDQATRNDVTRSRPSGSSARATLDTGALSTAAPPLGVGRYTDSQTINVHSDDQLQHQAGWWLHLGTWDEARYPQITVNLTAGPWLAEAVCETDLGDMVTIANPPPWLAPGAITAIAEGYSEILGWADWTIAFNCTPAGPWQVGVLDDPLLGRLDTAGAALVTAAASGDTTLYVDTTAGPYWTPDPSDYPYDLTVSGEVVRAEAVGAPILSPNPWMDGGITGWSGQGTSATVAPVTMMRPDGQTAPVMQITPDGVSASGGAIANNTAAGSVTPGATYTVCLWAYSPGGWGDLRPAVDWYDASSVFVSSGLGSGFTVPAGRWTFLTQTVVAPAGASTAKVRARHGGTPGASAIWFAWGVRIMAAAISGGITDSFSRTVSSGWGAMPTGQAWTRSGGSASDYSVNGSQGILSLGSVNVSRQMFAPLTPAGVGTADFDVAVTMGSPVTSAGASHYLTLTGRYADSSNYYSARVELAVSGAVTLTIRKNVAGVATTLATFITGLTHTAGATYRIRLAGAGSSLSAKVWAPAAPEPDWQATATDTDLTAAGNVGVTAVLGSGSTNTVPVAVTVDDFTVLNPQALSVTRSRNGIVKALPAGSDVRLANPLILAL